MTKGMRLEEEGNGSDEKRTSDGDEMGWCWRKTFSDVEEAQKQF